MIIKFNLIFFLIKMNDEQPKFPEVPLLIIILLVIFFPIGIFVFWILVIIYLARWMCYNLQLPRIFCYIIAFLFGPIFIPFLLLSFIIKAISGGNEVETRKRRSPTKKKKSPTKK